MIKNLLLCLSIVLAPFAAAAEDAPEPPTAEDLQVLAQEFGLPFEGVTAGRPAVLVLSLGCSHCIDLATKRQDSLRRYFADNDLNVRLVEMPQAVSRGPTQLIPSAQKAAATASLLFECTSASYADDLLRLMSDIGNSAIFMTGGAPDPKQPRTSNWKDWVYLAAADEAGVMQSNATNALRLVISENNIDTTGCGSSGEPERIDARLGALRETRIPSVPLLYLLPDSDHPNLDIVNGDVINRIGR